MRGGIARGLSSVKCLVIVLCIAFPSAESFAPPLSRLARTRGRVSSTRARSLSLGVRKGRQDDTTGFNLSNLSNLSETQRGLAVLTTVPLAWGKEISNVDRTRRDGWILTDLRGLHRYL